MQLTNALDGGTDRGVSPVIGVILMVAITVVLAAVIGTFVLDQGARMDGSGPTAQLAASDAGHDYDPADGLQEFVTLTHNGGEALNADSIRLVLRNGSSNAAIAAWQGGWSGVDPTDVTLLLNGRAFDAGATIATGDALTLRLDGANISGVPDRAEYRIQVIHPDSDLQLLDATVLVS